MSAESDTNIDHTDRHEVVFTQANGEEVRVRFVKGRVVISGGVRLDIQPEASNRVNVKAHPQ